MAQLLEMYVKEKNLLQLSLFYFGRGRPKETVVEWEGSDGVCRLECVCKYGVPGAFDQDVYTATLRVWVEQDMPHECIKLTYSDIARILKLKSSKNSVGKIKKSLEKLGQARYELKRCFIKHNGDKDEVVHFSLFDAVVLHNRKKTSAKYTELYFPDLIRENLEAKYYQRLDMAWYRALPSGLPRRLYEYLEKRKYHCINGTFSIAEEILCRWLPITDSHTTNRRKTLKGITQCLVDAGYLLEYDFDRTKKQCTFTYAKDARPPQNNDEIEIKSDKLQSVEQKKDSDNAKVESLQKSQYEQQVFVEALDWIQSIPYFHQKKSQDIASLPMSEVISLYPRIREAYEKESKEGNPPKANWVYNQFVKKIDVTEFIADNNKNEIVEKLEQEDFFSGKKGLKIDEERLEELIKLMKIKKISKNLMKTINNVFAQEGYDYVKWNILYANKKANKNYGNYLEQSIKNNWGENFAESEKEKEELIIANQKAMLEVNETPIIEEEKEDIEKIFLEKITLIDQEIKFDFWQESLNEIPKNAVSHAMNVRIAYFEKLKKYMNDNGENFDKDMRAGIKFIKKITKEMESK